MKKERNSSFELLRLISMFMILLYHFHCHLSEIYPELCFKVFQLPLHIGVILFILISGYFGIKFSISGFISLLIKVALYSIGIMVIVESLKYINGINGAFNPRTVLKSILFISGTPLWFVRTYILLYLCSPLINECIKRIRVEFVVLILSYFSIFIGLLGQDHSLEDGKNIINFLLIYSIGAYLHSGNIRMDKRFLVPIYLIINLILIGATYIFYSNTIGQILWKLSFGYNSPILIINAIIFFNIFSQIHISSRYINKLGASTFAIYLIHEHSSLIFIYDYVNELYNQTDFYLFYPLLILICITIMGLCITIDYFAINKLAIKIADKTLKTVMNSRFSNSIQ